MEPTINTAKPKILFVEIPGYKPLPDSAVIRVAADGSAIESVTDINAALAALKSPDRLIAVVTNAPELDLFKTIRSLHPGCSTILLTDLTMEQYSVKLGGEEHNLVDILLANRCPSAWTTNELRITLQKFLRKDYFGIAKYLAPATPIVEAVVTGSSDREILNANVMNFAEQNRLGQYMSKLVFGITEELLMNAIYDAPVAGGAHHYNEMPRTTSICLRPEEYSKLSYGCDGTVFGVSVTDPFGALTKDILYRYLKKVLRRQDSSNLIDTKRGGAGLGLFKILYSSHSLICNVIPHQSTEVMALIDIHHQVRDFSRMTRSVAFFTDNMNAYGLKADAS